MLIFIATGRLSSKLESETVNPVRGLTFLGKFCGPYPSTGYTGVAVGDGVGVSVSEGVNGLGVDDAVIVESVTVSGLVATASTGLGSPFPQAVINHTITNRTDIIFIRIFPPKSETQVEIILDMREFANDACVFADKPL
jgi:hypothetical protein